MKKTLREVAKAAGVSVTTASTVLSGRVDLYRAATVHRVLQAAEALEYRPNLLAKALVQQRARTLGLVVERHQGLLSRNPYIIPIMDGILDYLIPREYSLVLISLQESCVETMSQRVFNSSIDAGIVVAPLEDSPLLQWHAHSPLPVVFVGCMSQETDAGARVDVDNAAGMRSLVEWLYAQGHREFGFIGGPQKQWSARLRKQSYLNALLDYGIPARQEWMVEGDYTYDAGFWAGEQLLSASRLPSVVVVSNDLMAVSFMELCRAKGIVVPDQLSVTGFDGIDLGQHTSPTLTTVAQPLHDIGYIAAEWLLKGIDSGEQVHGRKLLAPRLEIRESARVIK